jgi:hypothetical protein
MSPSAKVFPLKPRSTEMLSSGSLTTLYKTSIKNKNAKVSNFVCMLHAQITPRKKEEKTVSSRESTNPIW